MYIKKMRKQKNIFWIIAGSLNLLTFFAHLFSGQLDLVNPMLESSLSIEKIAQLIGSWHIVTLIIFFTSCILLLAGFDKKYANNLELIKLTAYLNLSFCLPFILSSIYYDLFVPQCIFFLPIAIFTFFGIRKKQS